MSLPKVYFQVLGPFVEKGGIKILKINKYIKMSSDKFSVLVYLCVVLGSGTINTMLRDFKGPYLSKVKTGLIQSSFHVLSAAACIPC